MAVTKQTSYVPPSKRSKPSNQTSSSATLPSTKKKELGKKEFSLDNPDLFPSLGETLKNSNINKPMSFSSAAAKKIEEPIIVKPKVAPGWVHIRNLNGKIAYKYGDPVSRINYAEHEETVLGNILFNYRMKAEQYERDMDVLRLGDLSEYYGEPTLAEIHEANMREMINDDKNEDSSYDESDENEDLYY